MKAHLRSFRASPKKVNVVAGLIRGHSADQALTKLKFYPKKAAAALYKTLHSAVANAENNGDKKRENLIIDSVVVNKGPVWRRAVPSTRGRSLPIRKPTVHISIHLSEKKS